MIAMDTNRLVDDYLRRLEEAAAHLQRSRRAELVGEIRAHIESALRQEDAANEVAVRNVLERLGPPEEIVEAAEPPAAPSERAGWMDIGSLLALIVPVIGWVVGMVLVFASAAWTRRDKLIALSLLLVLVLLPALGVIAVDSGGVDQQPVPVGGEAPAAGIKETESTDAGAIVFVTMLGMLAGLPSALYLGWRLRRHPNDA